MPIVIVVIVLVIQSILAFGHVILFKFLVSALAINNSNVLLTLKIALSFLAISFILASVVAFKFYNPLARWFYVFAAIWLGILLYLSLAAFIYWLAVLVTLLLYPSVSVVIIGKVAIVLALIISAYGIVNANNLQVKEINVQLPGSAWQGKRAVWVSDIHLGHVRGLDFLNKIVKATNELKPDIIFVGGDVYDGTAFPIHLSIDLLSELKAPMGKYFITGNHEEFGDNTKYLNVIGQAGIIIMTNEVKEIEGVQLIGVDFNSTIKQQQFKDFIDGLKLNDNMPTILLKHAPFHLAEANNKGIDFQISGHTHRAQMWPLNFITWLVYRGYDYGLKKFGNMTVYTSSGVNTWGPPLKVGNPSEIVLVNFK